MDMYLYSIYILIILILSIFGFAALRLLISLKNIDKIESQVKGNKIAISKLKGEFYAALEENVAPAPAAAPAPAPAGSIPDLSNMSLEEAAAALGLEASELNSPLVRPLAEKIFNQLKNKQQVNNEENNLGY